MKFVKRSCLSTSLILLLFFSFFYPDLFSSQINDLDHHYARLFKQAEKLRADGEFLSSTEVFKKSLNIAQKNSDKEKECESLIKLGLLYWNIGELKVSSDYYRQALSLAQKFNFKKKKEECQSALEIYRLYSTGKKHRSSGQHQKSIESFQKAIHLTRITGSKEHEVKCLRQLSATYWKLNNLQEFFTLNKEALKIAKKLNHKKEEGRCLINIGKFYEKIDHYSKALNHYEEALKITQSFKNKEDESACLNNIGIIYKNIGNYDKSLAYLMKALTIDQELGDEVYISMDLNNIGMIFRSKGLVSGEKEDFYKALNYFEQSLQITKKTGDRKTEVEVLNNTGNVHSDLKNYHQALEFFQSGYKKAEEIQDKESMGMILNNMGIVNFNQGNYAESTEFYQKAIDLALEIEGGQILWEAYLEIANAFTKQKKFKDALENYKNSISIIEDVRSQIKLEELKASYLGTDKRIEAYHNLIHLLIILHQSEPEKGYDLEAFDYLERAKARAFLDSLEISQVNISRGIDFKLLNQEKELMKDISKLYTKLLAAELSAEEKNKIHEELNTFENTLETLRREIRTKSPAYASLKYPEIISLDEVQGETLDGKSAFFAYSMGKENSYAFVVTKKYLRIFPIYSRKNMQKQVSDYLKVITDKESQNFHLGYELFSRLVLPGLDKNIKNLIFIPDDILHFLPFETLITHEEKKKWLVEDYKIAYVPSISSFQEIVKRKKSKKAKPRMDLLAFGDPFFGPLETEENGNDIFQNFYSSDAYNFFRLKYSGLEIDRISSFFKNTKKSTFQRERATEEQLKEHNLEDYKIIHFATHSLINDKRPARSSIVLSLDNNPKEDGFLQMREIYNLKLNSDLVTLSSCQTGLGQFIKGEGIEGLNRAFFFAGASSILMSLWAINDQASYQLMERFYSHLRSSESIVNALRKAKLEMIASENLSHPYHWAGFVVSGKADQVIFPGSIKKWFLSGVFFLLAGGIILLALRRFNLLTGQP